MYLDYWGGQSVALRVTTTRRNEVAAKYVYEEGTTGLDTQQCKFSITSKMKILGLRYPRARWLQRRRQPVPRPLRQRQPRCS
jgi:hypothetical protein